MSFAEREEIGLLSVQGIGVREIARRVGRSPSTVSWELTRTAATHSGQFSLIVLDGQIQEWLGSRFGFGEALLAFFIVFRWVIVLAGLLLAFSLIYYLAPNVEQKFRFFTAGSIVGVVFLLVASLAFA